MYQTVYIKFTNLWCSLLLLCFEKHLLLMRTLRDSRHILPSCLITSPSSNSIQCLRLYDAKWSPHPSLLTSVLQQSHHTFSLLFLFSVEVVYLFLIMSLTFSIHFFSVVFLIFCFFAKQVTQLLCPSLNSSLALSL